MALGANTTYYLVARGTALTPDTTDPLDPIPGFLAWNATNVNTTGSYDTTNGTSWNGPYSQNLYMSVAAVPEPASATLLGVGLVAVAALLRRGTPPRPRGPQRATPCGR